MRPNVKYSIASAIIFVAIAIDTLSRWFGYWELPVSKLLHFSVVPKWYNAWDVFDFCNISALLLLAFCGVLISDRQQRAVSIFTSVLMLSLLYDKLFGLQRHVRTDDIFWWCGSIIIPAAYLLGNGVKLKIDKSSIYILIAGILKIITDNLHVEIHFMGIDRTLYEMGNATAHFILAIYITRLAYYSYNRGEISILNTALPVLLFAATFNDARDNDFGNPYEFQHKELILMYLVLATLVILILRLRYINKPN